jgi:hypothetical protein
MRLDVAFCGVWFAEKGCLVLFASARRIIVFNTAEFSIVKILIFYFHIPHQNPHSCENLNNTPALSSHDSSFPFPLLQ